MSRDIGREVLQHEARAISDLANNLGEEFDIAVKWILETKGRVLTCGVGKSGHIGRKVAGTFSSTGTPSAFMHAAEAVHGDLGMVSAGDVVILYSNSGETDEIVKLFPSLNSIGAKTILITARSQSSSARLAHLTLATGVEEEACVHNLAPTTSTTVMLALSDALAIAVMEARGFSQEDFARFHPQGSLGKRLTMMVADSMRPLSDIAIAKPSDTLLEATRAITKAGVGGACVVDENGRLLGFISDGDFRRMIAGGNSFEQRADQVMTTQVTTIGPNLLAVEALEFFQNLPKKLGELPVVHDGKLVGLLMLKDLLRSGIV